MGKGRGLMGTKGMVKLTLRYVHQDVDRHGNRRIYFWRRGSRKVRIREPLGTPAFFEVYRKLLADAEAGKLVRPSHDVGKPEPGTYRWLCTQYFSSAEFRQLDPRTQTVRKRILEMTFDERIAPNEKTVYANFPLSRMTTKAVKVLRDRKFDLPEAANARVKAIRQVWAWGIQEEHVNTNPARDVRYLRGKPGGFHSWEIQEVERFEKRHPIGTKARLAFGLLLYTGQRRSDVVLFGRQHVHDGALRFTQVKGRNRSPKRLELPVLPELQKIIDASPTGNLTFLVTKFGKPFTADGFGNWFRRRCDEAGLPHCSAHGLRKAGATIAAENGATGSQLMAIFGWETMKEAERYTKAARQKKMARDAMPKLLRTKNGT
jgi:integrase